MNEVKQKKERILIENDKAGSFVDKQTSVKLASQLRIRAKVGRVVQTNSWIDSSYLAKQEAQVKRERVSVCVMKDKMSKKQKSGERGRGHSLTLKLVTRQRGSGGKRLRRNERFEEQDEDNETEKYVNKKNECLMHIKNKNKNRDN